MKIENYTVHLDLNFTGERNDFLVQVEAESVSEAVAKAKAKLQAAQEYEDSDMECAEVLDVFKGHIDSLWDRPLQKPI